MNDEVQAEVTDPQAEPEIIQEQQQEFEIKMDSPPDETRKKNPMITRIIGQRDKARDENDELRQKVQALEDKLKPQPVAAASPRFEDYETTEGYEKAVADHMAQKLLNKQPKIDPVQQFQRTQQLNQGLDKHYSKAEKLAEKFPTYSQAEERAREILGDALAQEIALRTNNSPELMLFLGSNPSEAHKFKALADSDSVQAGVELGRLDQSVRILPKNKQPLPEPDEVLSGNGGSDLSAYEQRADKLRKAGDVQAVVALKREARAKGINLE